MTRLNDERLTEIVGELASKPGHDKVKAGIQDLLVDGLGAERNHVRFEQRVPEAQGRIDAILGRTAFEVKSDLIREFGDAEAQLARYLPERESPRRAASSALPPTGSIGAPTNGETASSSSCAGFAQMPQNLTPCWCGSIAPRPSGPSYPPMR
jgi:hypothetical protein